MSYQDLCLFMFYKGKIQTESELGRREDLQLHSALNEIVSLVFGFFI